MRELRFVSIAALLSAATSTSSRRIFGFETIKRHCNQALKGRDHRARTSIATGNRHGGAHEHKREIARRLRQQAARG